MSRLIFLFAIAALVYLLIKSYRSKPRQVEPKTEDMVCCARCGVHLPAGESIRVGDQVYCCEAHARHK